MLSNLETEKSKLLQIVLVGQPNLRDKLAAPELEQLRQRITVSYHLPPLDAEETCNYINHRLRRAALAAPLEFPREATDLIHARSRGVPRIINVICDAALVFGYAEERRVFDAAMLREVLSELEVTGVLPAEGKDTKDEKDTKETKDTKELAAAMAGAVARPAAFAAPAMSAAPARPAAATSSVSAANHAYSAALDQRERALQQRELELAEQRRVLAEEYRLMRQQHAAQAAATAETVAATSHGHVRLHVAGAGPTRFDSVRAEGFWDRVKRIMLGVSAS